MGKGIPNNWGIADKPRTRHSFQMEPLPAQADLLSPELEGQLDWELNRKKAELRTERELTHGLRKWERW